MADELPSKYLDFYKTPTASPIKMSNTKPTSISTQKQEVASFVIFVRKRLPNMSENMEEKLANFLTSAPVLPLARNLSGDEIVRLNHRSTEARAIAEKLIDAGFGSARNQAPLIAKPNVIVNLATLLMNAPAAGDTISEPSFKRDFIEWKGQFVVALQGIKSRSEGAGRSR